MIELPSMDLLALANSIGDGVGNLDAACCCRGIIIRRKLPSYGLP